MPSRQPTRTADTETVTTRSRRPDDDRDHEARAGDIRMRNFDTDLAHHVTVRITTTDNEIAHEKQYFLPPAATIARSPVLDPGRYSVTAVMDRKRCTTKSCRVGTRPDSGVIIDMGNGVISVTGPE